MGRMHLCRMDDQDLLKSITNVRAGKNRNCKTTALAEDPSGLHVPYANIDNIRYIIIRCTNEPDTIMTKHIPLSPAV